MKSSSFTKAGASAALSTLQALKELRRHPSVGYAMAVVTVAAATGVQSLAQEQYVGAAFLTIYPAVILATLIGGPGAGFLAAIFAGITQWGLFIPTLHVVAVASYAVDATLCVMVIEFINRTFDVLLLNIDQEKRAKQQQSILAKELHHRIQNLLTVVQAVIRFSLPGDGMIEKSVIRQR